MPIGSALTAIGSLAGTAMNLAQQSQTNAMNRAMVHQQNQWNLDQWHRENAYNHPVNQVQRLRAAGINPGILYGSGGVTNTSAPSPDMQASRDVAPQISGLDLGNPLQDALLKAQIEDIRASARLKDEQAVTESSTRANVVENLSASTDSLRQQVAESVARINRLSKENELTDAQIADYASQAMTRAHQLMNDDARLVNETALNEEQVKLLKADVRKKLAEARVTEREFYEMVETFALRKTGLIKSNSEADARIKVANATALKLGLESDVLEPQALHGKTASRRQQLFGNPDKSKGYVLGDFLQYLVENVAIELGHVIH